jgi:hypothetical protein
MALTAIYTRLNRYNTLSASGGWLARTLKFPTGEWPITFEGFCAPKNQPGSVKTFKPFGINYIEPPKK